MKKTIIVFLGAFFLSFSMAISQTIVGSSHDFSSQTWNTTNQICIVCHTPHNANISVTNAPLWNHTLTNSTFQLYTSSVSGTFNGITGQPDGSSKLCLSCHDGSVALENFGGTTTGTHFAGSGLIGTDLRDDHPISFLFDATLALTDGHLKNPTTALSGLGGTIQENMLISNKMQCSSCHDVHNSSGVANLLIKSNAASGLCLTCHIK
jgi:predicted CXXCH cytochrome family protein